MQTKDNIKQSKIARRDQSTAQLANDIEAILSDPDTPAEAREALEAALLELSSYTQVTVFSTEIARAAFMAMADRVDSKDALDDAERESAIFAESEVRKIVARFKAGDNFDGYEEAQRAAFIAAMNPRGSEVTDINLWRQSHPRPAHSGR